MAPCPCPARAMGFFRLRMGNALPEIPGKLHTPFTFHTYETLG